VNKIYWIKMHGETVKYTKLIYSDIFLRVFAFVNADI